MKTNKIIGLLTVVAVLAGGYFIYNTKFWIPGVKTKAEAIVVLVNSGKTTNKNNALNDMQEGYLVAWANAVLKNKHDFSFEGAHYATLGGKIVKK